MISKPVAQLLLRVREDALKENIRRQKSHLDTLQLDLLEAKAAEAEAKNVLDKLLAATKIKSGSEILALVERAQKNYSEAQHKLRQHQETYDNQSSLLKNLEAMCEEGKQLEEVVSHHWPPNPRP